MTFLATLAAEVNKEMGAGTRNRLIEFTQAGIAIAFCAAYIATAVTTIGNSDALKEFVLIIVPFYFLKRSDFTHDVNGPRTGTALSA